MIILEASSSHSIVKEYMGDECAVKFFPTTLFEDCEIISIKPREFTPLPVGTKVEFINEGVKEKGEIESYDSNECLYNFKDEVDCENGDIVVGAVVGEVTPLIEQEEEKEWVLDLDDSVEKVKRLYGGKYPTKVVYKGKEMSMKEFEGLFNEAVYNDCVDSPDDIGLHG